MKAFEKMDADELVAELDKLDAARLEIKARAQQIKEVLDQRNKEERQRVAGSGRPVQRATLK